MEKHTKAFKWSAGISLGRGTQDIEEVFAISVLAVISKAKERETGIHQIYLSKYHYSVNSGLRTIPLEGTSFLDLTEREACCFTWSFKENTIGCNFTSIRPICFKICRIVALKGILQYTKRCDHNILCPDTALRIVLSEWLTRQMIAMYGTNSRF